MLPDTIQYCSLQHWILLLSPETSTAENHICFGPDASFILRLLVILLCSFPVAYWTTSDLGDASFGVISYLPFMQSYMHIYIYIYIYIYIEREREREREREMSGEGNGTPLQYSCLESPMDREAWKAVVHGGAKSRTRLSNFTFTFHFHALERKWQPTPLFLPGESQARRSLVGCCLWGRTESDMTEAT